ncbi:hypothetical protein [Staphylococcus epidermidis]|uniref:hypothetical protein n=1 Tax=Staphylococcus epidermidis TaxID=1282 RepID=UPI0037D9AF7B
MHHLTQTPQSKQPLQFPSSPSLFQTPPPHFPPKLIQHSNLHRYPIPPVQLSTNHPPFILNLHNPTPAHYQPLIHHLQKILKQKFHLQFNTHLPIIPHHPTH